MSISKKIAVLCIPVLLGAYAGSASACSFFSCIWNGIKNAAEECVEDPRMCAPIGSAGGGVGASVKDREALKYIVGHLDVNRVKDACKSGTPIPGPSYGALYKSEIGCQKINKKYQAYFSVTKDGKPVVYKKVNPSGN